jgi:hypothetical protein
MIVFYRSAEWAIFVYGFAKNERDDINDDEKLAFRKLAREMRAYDDAAIAKAVRSRCLR